MSDFFKDLPRQTRDCQDLHASYSIVWKKINRIFGRIFGTRIFLMVLFDFLLISGISKGFSQNAPRAKNDLLPHPIVSGGIRSHQLPCWQCPIHLFFWCDARNVERE